MARETRKKNTSTGRVARITDRIGSGTRKRQAEKCRSEAVPASRLVWTLAVANIRTYVCPAPSKGAMADSLDPIGPLRAALAGRYEIGREIGQGAFATVYLAKDSRHDRQLALKVLNADPSSETGELRFIREIRMLARLQHPNILALHDSGHVEALLYYLMPYVSGETLRGRISRGRQMPIDAAVRVSL